MKAINQLMLEIIQLTTEIETNYPELYKYLGETPVHLCEKKNDKVGTEDLKEYLATLKAQLLQHIKTHKSKPLKSL